MLISTLASDLPVLLPVYMTVMRLWIVVLLFAVMASGWFLASRDDIDQGVYLVASDYASFVCRQMRRTYIENVKCALRPCLLVASPYTWARFGNLFLALYGAFHVAENAGIKEIHIPRGYAMFRKSVRWHDIDLIVDQNISISRNQCYNIWPAPWDPVSRQGQRRNTSLDQNFKMNFAEQFDDVLVKLPADLLAIHIRTGDIFKKKNPNPDYGQPPCSYYKEAISWSNWSEVWMFAEDNGNPCVDVLKRLNVKHVRSTGDNSLRSDMGILMSARNLVISRGTFGVSLAMASLALENLWTCSYPSVFAVRRHHDCTPSRNYMRKVMGLGKWHNKPNQHSLMLTERCAQWRVVE